MISWLDYGPGPKLSDRPTPRNSAHRFKRPVMAYPEWIAALPREAFETEEDRLSALMIAEAREKQAKEEAAAVEEKKPAKRSASTKRAGKSVRGEMYV